MKEYEWFYQEYISNVLLILYSRCENYNYSYSTAACVCVSVYSVGSDFIISLLDIGRQTRLMCYT